MNDIRGAHEDGRPDLVDVTADVVLPALRRTTRADEVDEVSVRWTAADLGVRISLRGEVFENVLWAPSYPPWSAAAAEARLTSDLQDFIAESAFGWGELRAGGPAA